MGCKIPMIESNLDLEEIISNYKKLNGCIKRHFVTSMRKGIKQRLNNITALKYARETWTLTSRCKQLLETVQMTRRNIDLITQLREINIVEEIEHY